MKQGHCHPSEIVSYRWFAGFHDRGEEQKQWLFSGLAESTADWRIVLGHHPVYSAGGVAIHFAVFHAESETAQAPVHRLLWESPCGYTVYTGLPEVCSL